MKPITLSIVTPTYNQAQFLGQTIESILSQEGNFDIDYIIVNDGSTDNTLEVIEKYDTLLKSGAWPVKCKGISYRFWTRPNGGQTSAINEGLKAAKGEVLAWMNSDDYYMSGIFEKIARVFSEDPELDFLYGDSMKIYEDGRPPKTEPRARPDETFETLLTRGNSFGFNFFSRKTLDKAGYLDESLQYAVDLELWLRFFRIGKVQYLPATIGVYRMWGGSKTATQQKKFAEERKLVAKRYGGNIISPHAVYAWRNKASFLLNIFRAKTPRMYEMFKKVFYGAVDLFKYGNNNEDFTRTKRALIIGVILIAAGIALNQWSVGYLFRPSGHFRPVSGLLNKFILWSFQIVSVGFGFLLIKGRTPSLAYRPGWYKDFSAVVVTLLLVFVFLNIFVYALSTIKLSLTADENPVWNKSADLQEKIYPGLDSAAVKLLLDETWQRPFVYDAYAQFKERPHHGKFVNVSEAGFRYSKNQGSWPPDPKNTNIFFFGGSTTFGYGVADDQTIPSYLQEFFSDSGKNVFVYNFGRGYYYSTQERTLFEKLLDNGFIPNIAIFIDGVNDMDNLTNEPEFSAKISRLFDAPSAGGAWSELPLISLFKSLHLAGADRSAAKDYAKQKKIPEIANRYIRNKRIIEATAVKFGVLPIFVWQPAPTYKYDLTYHIFGNHDVIPNHGTVPGYPYMARYVAEHDMGNNFLYLADIQENLKRPLYVDPFHYTAEFSREIARRVRDFSIRFPPLRP